MDRLAEVHRKFLRRSGDDVAAVLETSVAVVDDTKQGCTRGVCWWSTRLDLRVLQHAALQSHRLDVAPLDAAIASTRSLADAVADVVLAVDGSDLPLTEGRMMRSARTAAGR